MKKYGIIKEYKQCKCERITHDYHENLDKAFENEGTDYYETLEEAEKEFYLLHANINWDSRRMTVYEYSYLLVEDEYDEDDDLIETEIINEKYVDFDYINNNYSVEDRGTLRQFYCEEIE